MSMTQQPMAEELLFGKLAKGGEVKIDVDKKDSEKLKFRYIDNKPSKSKKASESDSPETV